MSRWIVNIVLSACLSMAASFGAATPGEIESADKAWATAVRTRDIASLEKIFASGLIYAHASGAVEDKQKYIDRLKSGKQRYDSVTIETTKVVMYGESAVSHSVVRTTGVNDQGPFNDHVMMMHFWVRQKGNWILAAHQTTKVP
ncbi:MAG: nuclear transport factor 2 family protein [Bryobacteraceae bacterium]|nr:nuclear transport factor 2 family protein [Bryobacteraceae bacterium]